MSGAPAGWPVPPAWLRQPDQRSCGAAVLVAARVRAHPSYAAALSSPERVRAEVLRVHEEAVGLHSPTGVAQLPWPRALGTPPWAVAARLAALAGVEYEQEVIRFSGGAGFDLLAGATTEHPAALYVGSSLLPRHVVLVTGVTDGRLEVFEPSGGVLIGLPRSGFAGGSLGAAGWSHSWFAVLPRGE